MNMITTTEATDLERLEGVINRGKKTFVAVGNALAEIRSRKLYRASHGTFANYVKDRFGFSPQHAGRICKAAEVATLLEPIGSKSITESQARELAKASPDKRAEVVDRAAEIAEERGQKATAAVIAEARSEVEPPKARALKRRPKIGKSNQQTCPVESQPADESVPDLISELAKVCGELKRRELAEELNLIVEEDIAGWLREAAVFERIITRTCQRFEFGELDIVIDRERIIDAIERAWREIEATLEEELIDALGGADQ